MGKQRLDVRIQQIYPHYSRRYIQSLIMQGKVLVDERPVTKPGTVIRDDQALRVKAIDDVFVCRSGWKLSQALEAFDVTVKNKIVLDAGISTGGFTDCLLQAGACKVYGVDVGYGHVHERIRQDPRVTVLERTNLRYLTHLDDPIDMVTLDLSFISVLKVMHAVTRLLIPGGELIVLIKPQFEAGRHEVPKGGIIRQEAMQRRIVDQVISGIQAFGFSVHGRIAAETRGAKGNQEYLVYCIKDRDAT